MTNRNKTLVKGLRSQFRKAIAADIKFARDKDGRMLSRWEIAEAMTKALGEIVTKGQLDHWTANSQIGHRFPVEYLPVFAFVTGQKRALHQLIIEALPEVELTHELGKIKRKISSLEKKKSYLETLKNEIA